MASSTVSVREITAEDAERVGAFLHLNLNSRVPVTGWEALMRPPWASSGPNHGFQLIDAHGNVVGAYVAVYSTREGGATLRVQSGRVLCTRGTSGALSAPVA